MMARSRRCDEATIVGRLRKAEQFLDAADTIREFADDEHEVGDVLVTLCVHAGIAAADVLCCVALGEHALGEDHNEALALLTRVRPDGAALAKSLRPLLGMKTRAGYSHQPVATDDRKRAYRAAEKLVRAARDRRQPGPAAMIIERQRWARSGLTLRSKVLPASRGRRTLAGITLRRSSL
jgi:hypothetical protein